MTPLGGMWYIAHMKSDIQRINNIIGQLEGVKKMIESEKDCFEILTQVKATRSALESFTTQFLSGQFVDCLNSCKKTEQEDTCKKFIKEMTN